MTRQYLCKGDATLTGELVGDVRGDAKVRGVLAPEVRDIGVALIALKDAITGGIGGKGGRECGRPDKQSGPMSYFATPCAFVYDISKHKGVRIVFFCMFIHLPQRDRKTDSD